MADANRAHAVHEVFGLMARLVHRTSQDARVELDREQLNPALFQLLLAVGQRPGSLQRELSDRFGVSVGNVSMLLAKLEERGFVRRDPRGAANEVHLTDAGRELVDRLRPQQDAFMLARFTALTDAELDQLAALLHRLPTD